MTSEDNVYNTRLNRENKMNEARKENRVLECERAGLKYKFLIHNYLFPGLRPLSSILNI
jgi:hypothetical protein